MLNPRYLFALFGATVVLTSGVVGAALVTGTGPFAQSPAPELDGFDAGPAECATGNDSGVALELAPGDGVSHLAVNDTVEVPDLAHGVGNASVERTGPSNYTLSVETLEPDEGRMGAQCVGTVRYTANVTIPEETDEPFTVVIEVDGETVHTLHNGPNGAGMETEGGAADA